MGSEPSKKLEKIEAQQTSVNHGELSPLLLKETHLRRVKESKLSSSLLAIRGLVMEGQMRRKLKHMGGGKNAQ